jgi:hypothetical protein
VKSAEQIKPFVGSSKIAENMGFKRDFYQWEDLLRIGD